MKLFSTNKNSSLVNLRKAVIQGLAEDGGLFMPTEIPCLPADFVDRLGAYSQTEIALEISKLFLAEEVPQNALEQIAEKTAAIPAPLSKLSETVHVLELFHGPTLAFKDFGACFMARLMSHFWKEEDRELCILVATSGDTGSAVAHGFFNVQGIRVVLLYPSKKVSELQEKQLCTLGGNISALEVEGTFDDCQRLVKQAFVDKELCSQRTLSSANSINIARLIPQSFYYFYTAAELIRTLGPKHPPLVFSVPSGNFGNLTGGLFAKAMGLPVKRFIAATNANSVVVEYLRDGVFTPRPSKQTISNAMDVGNPSNFARMLELYKHQHAQMAEDIFGASFSDKQTRDAIREVYDSCNYAIDPHGAVAYLGQQAYASAADAHCTTILETAHPGKFLETMEEVIPGKVKLPEALENVIKKQKQAKLLSNRYQEFKEFLLS